VAIALDATYSVGRELSGVGVYSREILFGLARSHPDERFRFCYRPHRLLKGVADRLPNNACRGVLLGSGVVPGRAALFHGLNQRMPSSRFKRAVCTFHDLFVLTGEYSTAEFRARFAEQARTAADRSDLIVCVSAFTADQAHELLGVDRGRLRVVHHGVRPLPLHEVPKEPVILSVGAIQHRKNTLRLVEAFETVPEPWRLVLAGSPGGYGAAPIMERIESSRLRARIHVTGYITNDELGRWYSRASVFAFPSLDEGFGMPLLEGMSFGVPVIASTRSALPEVCGDAALLVDAEDVDALAGALHRLTSDERVRSEYGALGVARSREFTWKRAVERTWSVYRELL
jgi:glycosyltransferase involved in cell wall biosynthesis